jgi:sialidase-1
MFEETELFVGGQDDINTYRIPALICTKIGTVIAFCEGRANDSEDGSPTHLVLKRSTDNAHEWKPQGGAGKHSASRSRAVNMTWLPMQVLLASRANDAYMNPVPIIDQSTGVIELLVNYYPHYDPRTELQDAQTWLLTSRDEGANWSKPIDLTPQVGAQELGPGIGIQLNGGRLVVSTYRGVIYSDDHGAHWRAGGAAPGPINESQVVELADGSLLRNTRGTPLRTITISKDGGLTWGKEYRDPALTDPKLWDGCQASLARYTLVTGGGGKNRLLFANPADPQNRFLMTVRLSYDEGRTWPVSKLVKNGTGAYSSLTVLPDGTIGLIYETGSSHDGVVESYANLTFARFNLEWFTGEHDHLPSDR